MLKLILNNKSNKSKQKIIRFRKKGIIRYPLYDVVVAYKNIKNKGIALEKLGFFNPQYGVKSLSINSYRISYLFMKSVFVKYSVKKIFSKIYFNLKCYIFYLIL